MPKSGKTIKTVRVWDLPTRIYHWLQLVVVVGAMASGFFAPEWWLSIHVWLGYAIVGLISFRLIWGFLGSEFSRFTSFIFSPRETVEHVNGLLQKKPPHQLGHNPLGALMIFGMIAVLAGITASGLVNLGGVENLGPFAGFVDYVTGDTAGRIHLVLAIALIVMVGLHVLGVVVESRLNKISLVGAMISGDKPLADGEKTPTMRPARHLAAIFTLSGAAISIIGGSIFLSLVPASGIVAMAPLEDFKSECGDCHEVYHPSLLPKASWAIMMDGLDDHFGEDASLDKETTDLIAAYLNRYSSQAWDTEAANNLGIVDQKNPTQISATPFWKLRHADLDKKLFETKPVRGTGNCSACHKDAESGYFRDQNISIPKPDKPTQS